MKWHYFWPVTQVFLLSFLIGSFLTFCWTVENLSVFIIQTFHEVKRQQGTAQEERVENVPFQLFFLQITRKYLWQGLTLIARQRSQCGSLNWRQPSKFYSSQSDSSELFFVFFTGSEGNTTIHPVAEKKIPLTLHVSSFKVMQIWSKTKVAWIVGFAYPYSSPSISDITENWAQSTWNKNKHSF